MYWYLIILSIVPAIGVLFSRKTKSSIETSPKSIWVKIEDKFFLVWCFGVFLLMVLKSMSTGIDTKTYYHMYKISKEYFTNGVNWGILSQPLYYLTFGIPEMLGIPFKTTQLIIYAFVSVATFKFINRYSKNKLLTCFFFVAGEILWFYMSGIRQTIAICIGLYAIDSIIKHKDVRAIMLIIAAAMYHKSALVLIIVLIIDKLNLNIKQMSVLFIIATVGVIGLPSSILYSASRMFGYTSYESDFGITTNLLLVLMYICIAIFCVVSTFKIKSSIEIPRETRILFISMIIGTLFMVFSTKFYLVSRLLYYFQIPIYVILTNCTCKYRKKSNFVISFLIVILFIVYFWVASKSNTLSTVPYEFYWEAGERWI